MADGQKVRFYRGRNSSYKTAWDDAAHSLAKFKYAGCIYFAYDSGSLWLDGSNYGISGAEALDNAIVKVTYRAGDGTDPARITFTPKDTTKSNTYVYLPTVTSGEDSIVVTPIASANSTEYKIGLSTAGVLNNLKLSLKHDMASRSISIIDKNGDTIGSAVGTEDFTRDTRLKTATYKTVGEDEIAGLEPGKYLHMEFVTGDWTNGSFIDSSINDVYVNLTGLANFKAGGGISIDEENRISLSLSQNAETQQYLAIEDGSLSLTGINKVVEDSSAWLAGYTVTKVAEAKNIIDNYTINDISIGSNPTLDSDNISMDYKNFLPGDLFNDEYEFNIEDTSTIVGPVKQGDSMSVALIKIQNRVENAITNDVSALVKGEVVKVIKAIGDAIDPADSSYIPRRGTNYIDSLGSISEEILALDQSLKREKDDITKTYNDAGYSPSKVVVKVDQTKNLIDVQHETVGDLILGNSNGSEIIKDNKSLGDNLKAVDDSIHWNFVK